VESAGRPLARSSVPITSRWHFQVIFYSIDRVYANSARNILERVFLHLKILLRCTAPTRAIGSGALLEVTAEEGRPASVLPRDYCNVGMAGFSHHAPAWSECFEKGFAGVERELIVASDLPRSWNGYSGFLDRFWSRFNHGLRGESDSMCAAEARRAEVMK